MLHGVSSYSSAACVLLLHTAVSTSWYAARCTGISQHCVSVRITASTELLLDVGAGVQLSDILLLGLHCWAVLGVVLWWHMYSQRLGFHEPFWSCCSCLGVA